MLRQGIKWGAVLIGIYLVVEHLGAGETSLVNSGANAVRSTVKTFQGR